MTHERQQHLVFEAVLVVALVLAPAIAAAVILDAHIAGDVAAWVEALATLGAFVAAVLAVRYAKRVFTIEQRRDLRLDDERRSAQASQVSAWVGVKTYERQPEPWRPAYAEDVYGYYVRNASELPVWKVQIRIGSLPEPIEHIAILPPSPEPLFLMMNLRVREDLRIDGANSPPVVLEFTDTAGIRWIRDGAAPLTRVDSAEPR